MSQTTLEWLRFATPGAIIVICFVLLGRITELWAAPLPEKLLSSSLTIIVPAGVYYLTPFRKWANQRFFDSVGENLRAKMVSISQLADEPTIYTWQVLRGVFFHLVDNDKSLSSKASLAYFNGFIWTTFADIRVVSLVYAGISAILAWLRIDGSVVAFLLFLAIAVASLLGSTITTRRHRAIGDEQMGIIRLYHREELRRTLTEIRDRHHSAGN